MAQSGTECHLMSQKKCVIIRMSKKQELIDCSISSFCFGRKSVIIIPFRPNTPCKHQGCPKLVSYGTKYCAEHSGDEVKRISPHAKGYNAMWYKESKRFLKTHPFCKSCESKGMYTQATVVDHVIPHRGDKKLFWDYGNWQPLCKKCHDIKTLTEDKFVEYSYDIKV